MDDIEVLKMKYFQNDYDVPYKLECGYEIKIRPILVKDWWIFESSIPVITIRKNEINDIDIIQMSYLKFLIEKIIPKEERYSNMLANILYYSLGLENTSFAEYKKRPCIAIVQNDTVVGFIQPFEFDEIIKIILFQNLTDYDDRYIDPEVREVMDEYYKLKTKNSESPSLESRKAYVMSRMGVGIKELNEMTYRTFSLIYSSCLDSESYLVDKIIQASTKYEIKGDIQHPLFKKKKDRLEDIFVDREAFENKISGANG